MTRHLLPGEIIEAATRQLTKPPALEHLAACPECKGRIEAYRATRMAVVPAGATQSSEPGPDCPPTRRLARYAAGHKDPELAGHIATCDRCAWIVRDALAEDTEPAPPRRARTRTRILVMWCAVALVVLAFAGALVYRALSFSQVAAPPVAVVTPDSDQDITEVLARAYTDARPFELRLKDAGYSIMRPGVASDHSGHIAGALAAIQRRYSANSSDPEAAALDGRLNLLTGKYQDALILLTRVADVWPDDPMPKRDLGCAYALRGAAEDRVSDFEKAAALFRKVLEKQPNNPEAIFNLALMEEHMFHAAEATEQWKKFLATQPEAGWRDEATRHLTALENLK